MSELLTFVIAGAVAGSLYAIMASGLVMTYAASGVFNFAFGGIAFTSAVLYYELNTGLGWPIVPSAVVSILIFGPLLGWVLDRVMFRKLSRSGPIAQIVATVGLSIALPALATFVVDELVSAGHVDIPSVDNVVTPPGLGPTPADTFHLFGTASLNTNEIATLAAAAACALGLWLLVRRTRLGLRMRATVDRRDLASLRGIDPNRTSSIAWMLSTMLAALCGVLGAPVLALGSAPFLLLMLVAATAAVFARFRSIPIAFAGGLALGIVQDLVAGYVNPRLTLTGFSSAVPYVLTFFGLLFLLVDRRRKAGTAAEEAPPRGVLHDKPKWSRGLAWLVATVLLSIYALFIADTFWQGLIIAGLLFGLVFLSFTAVTGVGGMVSLAQATFVEGAALIAGLLVSHHAPFLVALLAGTATAAIAGLLVALPALRLGGLALALATLALALICTVLVFQLPALINGQLGWTITRPAIGSYSFTSNRVMYGIALALGLIGVWLVRNLQRSLSGRAMLAVRSSPVAATASGISPMTARLGLFTLSAALAGFGGVMFTMYQGSVNGSTFPAVVGLIWLAVAVTFGLRRPAFALVAGVVYEVFPQLLLHVNSSTVLPQILFGLGGIGLAKNPDGLSDAGHQIAVLWHEKLQPRLRGQAPAPAPAPAPVLAAANGAALAGTGTGTGTGTATGLAEAATVGRSPAVAAKPAAQPAARGAAQPSPTAALELSGIHAGYGDVEVLHGIDLVVEPGTLVGVLGANGAGKSTLCAVAAGLLEPWSGSVYLGGKDVTGDPPFKRADAGLLVAPESRGIFPELTVEENLRILLPGGDRRQEVYERFPVLGQRRKLAAGVLSGGEQQILTLAPVLVDPPKILVADEPSLGLAPQIVRQIFDLFLELRDRGVTLLVVEEKVRDVVPVADRLVIVELGRVAWEGRPSDGDEARLASAYLGMAGTAAV